MSKQYIQTMNTLTPASSSASASLATASTADPTQLNAEILRLLNSMPSNNGLVEFHRFLQQREAAERKKRLEEENIVPTSSSHSAAETTQCEMCPTDCSCTPAQQLPTQQQQQQLQTRIHEHTNEPSDTSLPSASSPSSSSSSSSSQRNKDKSSNPFYRSMAYAKSLARLRSSLVSAYACYRWALDQFASSSSTVSSHPSSHIASLVTSASSHNVAGRAAALSTAAAASSSSLVGKASAITRSAFFVTLRRLLHAFIFLWRFHSRRVHRFLRPYVLLLVRSRALSKLFAMLFPFLKHNLQWLAHAVFVSGSAFMMVRRFTRDDDEHVAVGAQTGLLGSMMNTVRELTANSREKLAVRWRGMRLPVKLLYLFTIAGSSFLVYTCISIIREHQARRQERLDNYLHLQSTEMSKDMGCEGFNLPPPMSEEQLRAIIDRSPDPTPDQTPFISPVHSHLNLRTLDDRSNEVPQSLSSSSSSSHTSSTGAEAHHQPSFSFHRDCSACVAAAIANPNDAIAYRHNHPPSGNSWPNAEEATSTTLPETTTNRSRSNSTSLFTSHPLASVISKRMEWSPGKSASSCMLPAPGTPVSHHPPPPSNLSFISPASQRLTNIRISQLRLQTESVERSRRLMQEAVRRLEQEALDQQGRLPPDDEAEEEEAKQGSDANLHPPPNFEDETNGPQVNNATSPSRSSYLSNFIPTAFSRFSRKSS